MGGLAMEVSMPLAVPPEGIDDPTSFYAGFTGRLRPSWSPADGLVVFLDDDPEIARLHAPLKVALRFIPAGTVVDEVTVEEDTLFLQTWPTVYTELRDLIDSPVPAEIRISNVAPDSVRESVRPLFTELGRDESALDEFMAGNGLLRVTAGTALGMAALDSEEMTPEMPNRVKIDMLDGSGTTVNPLQFLAEVATIAGLDISTHPLMSQLNLEEWIEVTIVDADGTPLHDADYVIYLADGSERRGKTDADGRIYETGTPIGNWWLDLPDYPSCEFRNNDVEVS